MFPLWLFWVQLFHLIWIYFTELQVWRGGGNLEWTGLNQTHQFLHLYLQLLPVVTELQPTVRGKNDDRPDQSITDTLYITGFMSIHTPNIHTYTVNTHTCTHMWVLRVILECVVTWTGDVSASPPPSPLSLPLSPADTATLSESDVFLSADNLWWRCSDTG